jgi:hypothetical protein
MSDLNIITFLEKLTKLIKVKTTFQEGILSNQKSTRYLRNVEAVVKKRKIYRREWTLDMTIRNSSNYLARS